MLRGDGVTYLGPDQVAQVKRRVDALAVYTEYLPDLRRAGSHFVVRCPWHDDRSPSLHVFDDGHHHCFGCGAHGDLVDLVQHKESCDFQGAIEILARKAGLKLEDLARTSGTVDDVLGLYRACEFATHFYERTLDTVTGARARDYLIRERCLTVDTIRAFRLGWAHGEDTLVTAALEVGISSIDLGRADLATSRDGVLRDRFFGRVMIPILDGSKRVIGFSARMLPDDHRASLERGHYAGKYVNSAETPIYHKGSTVYNLARARSACRQRERLVLCEGALDVIAASQAGYAECCAPLGTAFTTDQAALIAKAAVRHDVIIALDGDEAGQKAVDTVVRSLITAGVAAKVAVLPDFLDPSEALVEGDATQETKDAFAQALTNAKPGLPWILASLADELPEGDTPGRLRVLDDVISLVKNIDDFELRDLYLTAAAKTLKIAAANARRRMADAVVAESKRDEAPPPPPSPPADVPQIPLFELNEHGNAMRFKHRFGKDVVYCETWGRFLVWNGTHWELDEKGLAVDRLMVATIEGMSDEIAGTIDPDRRADLVKWRIKNKNDRPISNSINRLKSTLSVKSAVFDTDPWLFTVANGTLDLRTGELRPCQRKDFITRASPLLFDAQARNERWEAFLDSLANSDIELIRFIQRAAGYSATGVSKSQAAFMACGMGGAGKSTLIQAMVSVLGGYARSIPFEIFLSSHSDKRKWSLAEISQCRLVVCEESEEGKRFNASLIKQISGGTPIEAERKGADPFTYLPRFKVWFVCNDAPYVSDTDTGFWRRMHLIRCDHLPAKKDDDLQPYLTTDTNALQAILAWMVAGARSYAERGLDPPAAVRNANQAYRDDQDPLREVMAELFVLDANGVLSKSEFFKDYKAWCDRSGVKHPLSPKGVGQRLAKLGVELDAWNYDETQRRTVSAYRGIRVRLSSDHPANDVANDHGIGSLATASDPIDCIDDGPFSPDRIHSEPTKLGQIANDQAIANDSPTIFSHIVGYDKPASHLDLGQIANDPTMDPARACTRDDPLNPLSSRGGMESEPIVGEKLTRAQRASRPPSPDEDFFAPPAPPPRQPGDDEDLDLSPPTQEPHP